MYPKIYYPSNTEREVHMTSENVAVVWNTDEKYQTVTDGNRTHTTIERVRRGKPYIDLVWVREYDDGMYEQEENIGNDGMSAEEATALAAELLQAVEYLKKVE